MRLAFFSPVNPVESGISDYSESLLRALAPRCTVDLFVDGYRPSDPWITQNLRIVDCRRSDARGLLNGYDAVLYQMGGTPGHHKYMYDIMLEHPGVVMLHDLIYQGFFGDLWLKTGRPDLFIAEMRRSYGAAGEEVARNLAAGRQVPFETLKKYPMNKRMIDSALGVAVHSRSALRQVAEVRPQVRCRLIPHHDFGWSAWAQQGYDPAAANLSAKQRLSIAPGTKVLACFGFIVATKRPDVVLRAYARLRQDIPDSCLIFVGEEKYRVSEYLRFLELETRVRITGYTTAEEFRTYLEAADVCINLRYPSQGETSGAVLRMLALGKPVIVTNHAWFAELPDSACAKVDADRYEEDLLYGFCKALLTDADYRQAMGCNAHEYVRRHCALDMVAGQYLDFLAECAEGGAR
jgi:glycosyltransferase involved in cell wall biosynthesis